MGKTYIIGSNNWQQMAINLGADLILLPDYPLGSDKAIHDFLVSNFIDIPSIIVFDMSEHPANRLEIAMHIRLSRPQFGDGCLCPLVFVSDMPLTSFLSYGQSQLFLTEGVYLCSPSELVSRMNDFKPLSVLNFRGGFLDKIYIHKPEGSNHSLANQWGASRLYRIVSGKEITPEEYKDFKDVQKELYYKYILNKISKSFSGPAYAANERVQESVRKKILLIDDEADKGWAKTIEKIFPSSDFNSQKDVICEKVADYDSLSEEARQKIETGGYDLFLLDLRLNGAVEDSQTEATKMSGYKVLERIKALNKGNQVIMLTASNKAWNLRALLNPLNGASGYFVKESPEYEFSDEFSIANLESFKRDASLCFERGYLKRYWDFILRVRGMASDPSIGNDAKILFKEIASQLEISFGLCAQADNPTMYRYAFLSSYQVLEIIVSHYSFYTRKSKETKDLFLWFKSKRSSKDQQCDRIDCNGVIYQNKPNKFFSKSKGSFGQIEKLAVLYLQEWGQKDNGLIHLMEQLIIARNYFIHQDESKIKRVESQKKMIFSDFMSYRDFNDGSLIFSEEEIKNSLYEACVQKCMYDDGHFILHPNVADCKAGPSLLLECFMKIIPLIH